MTVSRGRVRRWQCTQCGKYITEGAIKYSYNFDEHPYSIVVEEI